MGKLFRPHPLSSETYIDTEKPISHMSSNWSNNLQDVIQPSHHRNVSYTDAKVYVFGLIVLALTLTMLFFSDKDYQWTIWLGEHRIKWLVDFMGRTIFEREGYGSSDTTTFFLATVAFLYFRGWLKPDNNRLYKWRPYFGFIISSGLICNVCMVHFLKWAMGRARPELVFKKGFAYSEWFEFGPHYVTEGFYRGSFPSGHTVSAVIFMTLAYILFADGNRPASHRFIGALWGVISLIYCMIMALGRAMSLGHWLGDCVFSIIIGWTLVHILYFWVLRMPVQIQYYREKNGHADTPRLWELSICLRVFLIALGGMAVITGIRAFWEQPFPWLAGLIVPGLFVVFFFGSRLVRFHRLVFDAYHF